MTPRMHCTNKTHHYVSESRKSRLGWAAASTGAPWNSECWRWPTGRIPPSRHMNVYQRALTQTGADHQHSRKHRQLTGNEGKQLTKTKWSKGDRVPSMSISRFSSRGNRMASRAAASADVEHLRYCIER